MPEAGRAADTALDRGLGVGELWTAVAAGGNGYLHHAVYATASGFAYDLL
jgi:hypothetical protein